jgi:N-acetylglutamate synthase-like GNAT family acetyltransferase
MELQQVAPSTFIRRARPDESDALADLALRSKGYWGYDADFLAACRDDLALSAGEIAVSPVFVYEREGGIAGYYRLLPGEEGSAELDALFVDPAAIGTGVGRQLWEHAVATARALGVSALLIQSDPNAEGFYRSMGAQRIGESQSTVTPGRMLPLLRYAIERRDRPRESAH